jgi:hypothetical protein
LYGLGFLRGCVDLWLVWLRWLVWLLVDRVLLRLRVDTRREILGVRRSHPVLGVDPEHFENVGVDVGLVDLLGFGGAVYGARCGG